MVAVLQRIGLCFQGLAAEAEPGEWYPFPAGVSNHGLVVTPEVRCYPVCFGILRESLSVGVELSAEVCTDGALGVMLKYLCRACLTSSTGASAEQKQEPTGIASVLPLFKCNLVWQLHLATGRRESASQPSLFVCM